MTLLADLVATSSAVGATRSRSAKVAAMADLLARLAPDEVETAVAFLAGEPRQGKVGVGWSTLHRLEVTPADEPSLTIADMDHAISRLGALLGAGTGSGAARQDLLAGLLARATADEGDFIRRLLLGELRQGALEGVVTEAVARASRVPAIEVRRALMLAGDLPAVARVAMNDGAAGLAAIGLRPLCAVQPMLAATAGDVAEAIAACGLSSVEWKLDGIRVQAHRDGDEVRLFTRNLNDATARMPAVAAVVRSLPADRVVLDGEVLGAEGVWFFDCLHVDGADLIDLPLVERAEALDRVAGPWRVPAVLTDDPAEATAHLDAALRAGHEGVMVKAARSRYEAGRRGQLWRKVKPVRTLDLVVLGAEWGHGRRSGWLSNLHLGARDPADGFLMVGKTFKGLTDELLTWQTERFLALEVARHGIVVEVRPELVVEVAVDGVQVSTRYAGGLALRFARVKRYRPDKPAHEADTVDAVRSLLPG